MASMAIYVIILNSNGRFWGGRAWCAEITDAAFYKYRTHADTERRRLKMWKGRMATVRIDLTFAEL